MYDRALLNEGSEHKEQAPAQESNKGKFIAALCIPSFQNIYFTISKYQAHDCIEACLEGARDARAGKRIEVPPSSSSFIDFIGNAAPVMATNVVIPFVVAYAHLLAFQGKKLKGGLFAVAATAMQIFALGPLMQKLSVDASYQAGYGEYHTNTSKCYANFFEDLVLANDPPLTLSDAVCSGVAVGGIVVAAALGHYFFNARRQVSEPRMEEGKQADVYSPIAP